MHIPATSSAALAAGIAAQASAKDAAGEAGQAAANAQRANQAVVEKSNESSPDRDAQGQADGLPGDTPKPQEDELEISGEQPAGAQSAPQLPNQPPGHLDIIG